MKILKTIGNTRYLFSNDGHLEVGDQCFPLTSGIVVNGRYFLTEINELDELDMMDHHIVEHINEEFTSHQVSTSHGFGPAASYYKVVGEFSTELVHSELMDELYRLELTYK